MTPLRHVLVPGAMTPLRRDNRDQDDDSGLTETLDSSSYGYLFVRSTRPRFAMRVERPRERQRSCRGRSRERGRRNCLCVRVEQIRALWVLKLSFFDCNDGTQTNMFACNYVP